MAAVIKKPLNIPNSKFSLSVGIENCWKIVSPKNTKKSDNSRFSRHITNHNNSLIRKMKWTFCFEAAQKINLYYFILNSTTTTYTIWQWFSTNDISGLCFCFIFVMRYAYVFRFIKGKKRFPFCWQIFSNSMKYR